MNQPNSLPALLDELETLFPDSLIQNIKASFNLTNGVEIINKINRVKITAAGLIKAFQLKQPNDIQSGYYQAALSAKNELSRLLKSEIYNAVIKEAIAETSRFEDVISLLWGANNGK